MHCFADGSKVEGPTPAGAALPSLLRDRLRLLGRNRKLCGLQIVVLGGDFGPNQRLMAYNLADGAERWLA